MKLLLLGMIIAVNYWLGNQEVKAQIVPDNSLNTEISTEENSLIIKKGVRRGENLFHSFSEFNVSEGEGVYFANPDNVTNIFSRVTGDNPSRILGTLGVKGDANLYLINPNGIIFGINSSLDLKGSFLATTANNILFADGFVLQTKITGTEPPLLTVSAPIGLGFVDSNGRITNRSLYKQYHGLEVPYQETIALVGGRVDLINGYMGTDSVNIELGAVNQGVVRIIPQQESFTLDYQNVESFRDVTLTGFSEIVTVGEDTGNIQIQGENITIQQSLIVSETNGGKVGDILLKASNNINISDYIDIGPVYSSGISGIIRQETSGNDGVIRVEAKTLSLRDGSQISAQNYSDRPGSNGSNVIINVAESVNIQGSIPKQDTPTAITSGSYRKGDAGNLVINTSRLTLVDGGTISTSTYEGTGNGGDLTINATEAIEMRGYNVNSEKKEYSTGIYAQVEPNSSGNGGNLTIRTNQLTAEDGAQISTTARNQGKGGNLVIEAGEFIHLRRTSPKADLVVGQSGIFVSAEKSTNEGGEIQQSTGDAGNLLIKTGELVIAEGAKISADTFGSGKGGNIVIEVDNLIVSQGGSLRAGSFVEKDPVIPGRKRGDGGTISIQATEEVRVTRRGTTGKIKPIPVDSNITSRSEGTGNAGGIVIISPHLFIDNGGEVSVSNSGEGEGGSLEITSDTVTLSQGVMSAETSGNQGGNVTLAVTDTLFLERESKITATAGIETGIGDGGNITLDTGFLVAIPEENNDIVANASLGRGGNIKIEALSVLGITDRPELTPLSDITASSEFGIDGLVSITTPDADPNDATIELSEQVIDIEWLRAQNPCSVDNNTIARGSSFIITGRGGVHPGSQDAISSLQRIVPWQSLETPKSPVTVESRTTDSIPTPQLINGWIITSDGTIYLTQNATKSSYQPHCLPLEN